MKDFYRKKTVAILMTTCNGEKFINEQINSILRQKGVLIHFYISDDNSTDQTLNILNNYFLKYPDNFKKLYRVNFKNCNRNFINLIMNVPNHYEYYALADHDDFWLKNKLYRAISILKNKNCSAYGCRLKVVDTNLKFLGFYSPLFLRKLSFKNALVQGIVGNATLVFNNKILKIFQKTRINFITDTAWLIYLITTYCGYTFFYDKKPMILYRQHLNNDHSISTSYYLRFKRILKSIFLRSDKITNDNHIKYLKKIKSNVPQENILTLKRFEYMKKNLFFLNFSLKYFQNTGIYRQTKIGNLRLIISFFLKLQ
jgi:glycosyltransferase involved in cell wall biosynthesis